MLPAGKLNKRFTIKTPTTTSQNAYGEYTSAPDVLCTVWGALENISVRELDLAKSIASTVSGKITIRFRDDVKPKYRITDGSKSWNVNGCFDPDGLKADLVLYVTQAA